MPRLLRRSETLRRAGQIPREAAGGLYMFDMMQKNAQSNSLEERLS
jgi:hypothetical protein